MSTSEKDYGDQNTVINEFRVLKKRVLEVNWKWSKNAQMFLCGCKCIPNQYPI